MLMTLYKIDWSHTSLLADTYLTSLDVCATTYRALVCQSCQIALGPEQMKSHLLKSPHHVTDNITIDDEQYETAIKTHRILATLPYPPTTTVLSPLAGLKIFSGLSCPHCNFGAPSAEGLRSHCDRNHQLRPPKDPISCTVQQLNTTPGPYRKFFKIAAPEVIAEGHSSQLEAIALEAEKFLRKSLFDPAANPDPRTKTPWLRSTGWLEVTQDLDPGPLTETVLPADTDYARLGPASLSWLNSIKERLPMLPKLVAQQVHTDDPLNGYVATLRLYHGSSCLHQLSRGITNHPLVAHMQDDTMIRYAAELERFLAMLLRPQEDLVTHYSSGLKDAIEDLRTAAEDPTTSLEPLIDLVLDEIWTVEWDQAPSYRISDPTERFLLLRTMQSDGTFLLPKNVTPLLAKFKYLIRVYMVRRMTDQGPRSMDSMNLQEWFWEKRRGFGTFTILCDLQHQASTIASATQELPRVFWLE